MKRRLLILVLAVLFLLGGCTSMFKKDYLSIAEYTQEEHSEYWNGSVEVSTLDELHDAITLMITTHAEEGWLHFSDYEGVVSDDLSKVLREVQYETPIGSFAVEHIFYDPVQILSYYEATVYISYKRSAEEVAAISNVLSKDRLEAFFENSLESLNTYEAINLIAADLTEDFVFAAIDSAFNSNPTACVLRPNPTVTLHPASGDANKIIEIAFNYGRSSSQLAQLKQELKQLIAAVTSQIPSDDPLNYARGAYATLAETVTYDPDGAIRGEGNLPRDYGSSAYGALSEGLADSQGIALAYAALMHERGFDCLVVSGTYEQAEHFWNLIRLDGSWYHVDVSRGIELGIDETFGRSDEQMTGYWWFIENYPTCPLPLDELVSSIPETEE
jgi:hypothetical protein